MRKKRFLPYIAGIMICVFTACSSENPEILPLKIPEITGEQIEQNHIQLVFCPTENNHTLTLNVTTDDPREKPVLISWGDGNKPEYYPQGVIEYKYPMVPGEYTITLYSPEIKIFKIEEEGANRVRSLYFGECPALNQISYPSTPNILRDLDLRACKQFNGAASLYIYDPEFDFEGLQNFAELYLYFYHSYPILIENLPAERIELYVTHRNYSALTVRDVPGATRIGIIGIERELARVGPIFLQGAEVINLRIHNVHFWEELPDLTGLKSLKNLSYDSVEGNYTLPVTPSLEVFMLDNQARPETYGINHLDFTICKNLRSLTVWGVKSLKTVNLEGLENLESVSISKCGEFEDFFYKKEKSGTSNFTTTDNGDRKATPINKMIHLKAGDN